VRILLLGMGSRGDVQPMLALGQRLCREGYAVSVAAARDFAPLVARHGLDLEPLSFDVREGVQSELGLRWLGGTSTSRLREARLMRLVLRSIGEPLAEDLLGLVDRADAFVSGPLTFEAMGPLARWAGKPHVVAMFQPTWPTVRGPSATFALRPEVDSRLNLAHSWGAAFAAWQVLRPPGDAVRHRLGLPKDSFRSHVAAARRAPTLLAVSPGVVPRAPEWGANVTTTGFWSVDEPPWEPAPELADFLAGGPPPVYLGLGSMATLDPAGVVRTFVEALARLGRRGILVAGWAELRSRDLPASVLAIEEAPHGHLFPHLSVVVHHGGAGTTAAARRAGVPQVAMPHIADQHYWGRRVHELGVGAAPIPRRALSVDRLVAAIEAAARPETVTAAALLGEHLRTEDGVGVAAEVIADLLGGRTL
jgi:UDP:flavonoid glycosyltransferase YjiC (YdhE family)